MACVGATLDRLTLIPSSPGVRCTNTQRYAHCIGARVISRPLWRQAVRLSLEPSHGERAARATKLRSRAAQAHSINIGTTTAMRRMWRIFAPQGRKFHVHSSRTDRHSDDGAWGGWGRKRSGRRQLQPGDRQGDADSRIPGPIRGRGAGRSRARGRSSDVWSRRHPVNALFQQAGHFIISYHDPWASRGPSTCARKFRADAAS